MEKGGLAYKIMFCFVFLHYVICQLGVHPLLGEKWYKYALWTEGKPSTYTLLQIKYTPFMATVLPYDSVFLMIRQLAMLKKCSRMV